MKRIIIGIMITYTIGIYNFDIKVLLEKITLNQATSQNIALSSSHGFIVSRHASLALGTEYNQKKISIAIAPTIQIQHHETTTPCYIIPQIAPQHKKQLAGLITQWIQAHHAYIGHEIQDLSHYIDQLVTPHKKKNDSIDYQQENDALKYLFKHLFSLFFSELINTYTIDNSLLTTPRIEEWSSAYLGQKAEHTFFEHIASEKLSSKQRKKLYKDTQYRSAFFTTIINKTAYDLLYEFVTALPRSVLAHILNSDIECITYKENPYAGIFALIKKNDSIFLINNVSLDDYILSVVRYEGWPGWPLEVNKVLAITCRTYAIWQLLQAQKSNKPYHIENTIKHQTYKGHHNYTRIKQAIKETKDLCIAYNNQPILAMFDCCCGGIIPADIHHPEYKKYPYLLRKELCNYCKPYKVAQWNITIPYEQMLHTLRTKIPSLSSISGLEISKKDKAGIVSKISIISPEKQYAISGKHLYSLFPEIKSFSFDITQQDLSIPHKKNKKHIKHKTLPKPLSNQQPFHISGVGYGHHIGLCQWGAMRLAKEYHWSYQDILQFYYPGTSLIKIIY